jgi:hypothetical protein
MLLSVPFVMVAVAFGWRPSRKDAKVIAPEPSGLSPADAAHVAVMKYTAWLEQSAPPVVEHVERLAAQLLEVNWAKVAKSPLGDVLSTADECDPELSSLRRRALGLALVAWSRADSSTDAPAALELGRACLAVGLNSSWPSPRPPQVVDTPPEAGIG